MAKQVKTNTRKGRGEGSFNRRWTRIIADLEGEGLALRKVMGRKGSSWRSAVPGQDLHGKTRYDRLGWRELI